MFNTLRFLLIAIIFIQCNNTSKPDEAEISAISKDIIENSVPDTLVAKQDVTKVIPGAELLRKAYSYVVIAGNDTSLFKCHFSQYKADSTLFFVTRFNKTKTYSSHMAELKRILAEAQNDFDLRTIKIIGLGRLAETGDLAVKVSRQYKQAFGSFRPVNKQLDTFLLHSSIGTDFNLLLQPYGLTVLQVVTEKKFFYDSSELSKLAKIETDPADLPEKILDCITYLKVGK